MKLKVLLVCCLILLVIFNVLIYTKVWNLGMITPMVSFASIALTTLVLIIIDYMTSKR